MRLKLSIFIFVVLCSITVAKSQELDSVSMTFENGLVVVKYDFLLGEKGVDYELYLYGSHDNFTAPLQHTTGDVGKNIQIGANKIIYWDAQKELGIFKGDFSLKVKGNKYIPYVSFKNIDSNLKIIRGESFNLKWKTSTKSHKVLLKINRNGFPVSDPFLVDNSGAYNWEVPAKLKPGKGYTFQILNTENLIDEETSENFSVRRKIPLGYKIIPAAIVALVAVMIISKDEDTGIPNPPGVPE